MWYSAIMANKTVTAENGSEWTLIETPEGIRARHHYPVVDIPSPIDQARYATEVEAIAAIQGVTPLLK